MLAHMLTYQEVLFKSFGNGVAMLHFEEDRTRESVEPFLSNFGSNVLEAVMQEPSGDVYVLLEEGFPVSSAEVRNTEDDWDGLVAAVNAKGSQAFQSRVTRLAADRKSLVGRA